MYLHETLVVTCEDPANSVKSLSSLNSTNLEMKNIPLAKNGLKDIFTEENIVLKLLDPKLGIKQFLSNTENQDLETCVLILKIILKASKNQLMERNFRELFALVLNSNFTKERFYRLINVDLVSKKDPEIIFLLISYIKLSFQILPGIAYDLFYCIVNNISMFVDSIRLNSNIIDKDIDNELRELKLLLESCKPNGKYERSLRRNKYIDDIDPPNDFREISIFPTQEDLDIKSSDVFLRRNRDNGIYKSVDDYLDVQFRLMREDFIQPLREGITELRYNPLKKNFDIRIYRRVFIINSLASEKLGIIYNLSFDISHLQKVNWIQSKRFIFGSFLCLLEDDSENLIFATVANREIKDLEKGVITVKFHNGNPKPGVEYTLIETTNMFESYRHVLLKLQQTNADNLCLQKYLVFADENISLPAYLVRNEELTYRFFEEEFYPGKTDPHWTRSVDLEFDESQFRAFQTSLTKEMTIIQGPPGTGKTYLGLKICQCLLENVQKGIPDFGPILIVCYTNHALDQFLEGILEFTNEIVRIGCRSSSTLLEDYKLINCKKRYSIGHNNEIRREIICSIKHVKIDLVRTQALLKMLHKFVIDLNTLRCFMYDDHYDFLKNFGIFEWLNGEKMENEFSDPEQQLNNVVESLIYYEIRRTINEIFNVLCLDIEISCEDEYNDNEYIDVNFINIERQVDFNIDDISKMYRKSLNSIQDMKIIAFPKKKCQINDEFTQVSTKISRKRFKDNLNIKDNMEVVEVFPKINLDSLPIIDRWNLYHYWLSLYDESLSEKSLLLENRFEDLHEQLNELSFDEDHNIMKKQKVIGMTATGAARYSRVLEEIKCKIIIVEEAAEVLESHVIGSLNSGCEHLILIGDHKQLKPNPTVYELARKYNLDLSLFERMINNGLHYNSLELQHRMRPEIAEIMKYIYPNLKNHESVLQYPNVPAVKDNIYFFNHTKLETHDNESSSYSNKFEAEFIVRFCLHLIKNGVENSKLTILTLYKGQLFLLQKLMSKQEFEGVRVCIVDNYQGEENDIIILSLVRSNDEDKIGFLNIENRICVSLSRAKIGLYVFGNFQLLTNKSNLWNSICTDLKGKGLLGDSLTLMCQNHPDKKMEIRNPDDFIKYPEGGCDQLCNQRMDCGHACRKCCHFLDKNHLQVKCLEDCSKLCRNGHRCLRKCWEECSPCRIILPKVIPGCGHTQLMNCFKDPEPDCCLNECARILKCGHKCLSKCPEKCGDCLTKVKKISPICGHEGEYFCSDNDLVCTKKCTETLECGHTCSGSCGECNLGRLHAGCGEKCANQLICGHLCKERCNRSCGPCNEKCEEGCFHNKCPKKCNDQCVPCNEECIWKCEHKICTKKCYEECNRDVCNKWCTRKVFCSRCKRPFSCYGVCGEKCRNICLKCDPGVTEIFFGTEDNEEAKFITLWTCGHSFEVESMDIFMKTSPDNGEIVAKRCPRCKSIINKRSCFRYLNIVRKICQDIKTVQILVRKNIKKTNLKSLFTEIEISSSMIISLFEMNKVENYFSRLSKRSRGLSNNQAMKYKTSLNLITKIYYEIYLKFVEMSRDNIDHNYIESAISMLLKWLDPKKRKFSNFEINQCNVEIERINLIISIIDIKRTRPTVVKEYFEFIDELKRCKSFSGEYAKTFCEQLKKFDYLPNMAITDNERKQIVQAIGLVPGRWFKCPQGHYYVIGEVGGANEIATCLECNSRIGGVNHRVLADNQFAPEMDGAQRPLYSDAANTRNLIDYSFMDLF